MDSIVPAAAEDIALQHLHYSAQESNLRGRHMQPADEQQDARCPGTASSQERTRVPQADHPPLCGKEQAGARQQKSEWGHMCSAGKHWAPLCIKQLRHPHEEASGVAQPIYIHCIVVLCSTHPWSWSCMLPAKAARTLTCSQELCAGPRVVCSQQQTGPYMKRPVG